MRICGLQKLTLLDYPGKTACTVFLGGCNFRCPFCHNASLVLRPGEQPDLTREEVLRFLQKRKNVLDGVCVTGGEPTLLPGLLPFLRELRGLGYAVKLDTNGTNPALLREALAEGLLDCVAMDIKSSPSGYAAAAGIPNPDMAAIQESINLLRSGAVPYEFRTTVVRELHTPKIMAELGRWLAGPSPYFLQNFVDSGDLVASGMSACSREELLSLQAAVVPYLPKVQLRGVE
ncbi:MAG: anaerobic ribonucleoside-triphosphate reductase activating protein [Oscillospiraceae bacterium]|nr:anaerobic ribonucleoside-triphosphate reductase activating protein [Oscillospiraceae bacterium]